jgi:hypothetical protein
MIVIELKYQRHFTSLFLQNVNYNQLKGHETTTRTFVRANPCGQNADLELLTSSPPSYFINLNELVSLFQLTAM